MEVGGSVEVEVKLEVEVRVDKVEGRGSLAERKGKLF